MAAAARAAWAIGADCGAGSTGAAALAGAGAGTTLTSGSRTSLTEACGAGAAGSGGFSVGGAAGMAGPKPFATGTAANAWVAAAGGAARGESAARRIARAGALRCTAGGFALFCTARPGGPRGRHSLMVGRSSMARHRCHHGSVVGLGVHPLAADAARAGGVDVGVAGATLDAAIATHTTVPNTPTERFGTASPLAHTMIVR